MSRRVPLCHSPTCHAGLPPFLAERWPASYTVARPWTAFRSLSRLRRGEHLLRPVRSSGERTVLAPPMPPKRRQVARALPEAPGPVAVRPSLRSGRHLTDYNDRDRAAGGLAYRPVQPPLQLSSG